jgi:hypothetical protein
MTDHEMTPEEIRETLKDLVRRGEVVRRGDRYFTKEHDPAPHLPSEADFCVICSDFIPSKVPHRCVQVGDN